LGRQISFGRGKGGTGKKRNRIREGKAKEKVAKPKQIERPMRETCCKPEKLKEKKGGKGWKTL